MRANDQIGEGPTLLSGSAGGATDDDAVERLPGGARAGDYELERFLGAGAMGDVYAGRHPLIGKRVAVKVIKRRLAGSADAVERFLREARAVNQVGHPNVVDIFAVGRLDDGRLYLVMDLLEGESLGARLGRGRPEVGETLTILEAVAAALDAAHGRGVIHRDLKPDNVFLAERGDGPSVYVLDFGIAKLLTTTTADGVVAAPGTLTDQGTWLGTPAYMAPEQWGSDGATGASDRYALGVMAFEMLAGRPPFKATSLPGMMEQHFKAAVPTLSTGAGAVLPPAVDQVLTRAMAKDPDHRYPSARAMVADLRAGLGTSVGKTAGASATEAGRSGSRRRVLVAVLGGATAIAAVVTGALVLRGGSSRAADRSPAVQPPEAAIEITSTPSGARVRVDGNDRGATPLSLPVPGRELTLVIDKPGYTPVTRKLGGDRAESLRVPLSPVTLFEGVWALPDGALRAFERRGEQVAMFKLASGTSEREFERFFEFVGSDPGLVAFAASETHVDPRAPDEPSCNVPLRAEYQYDVTTDALARRQERVALELEDGHCVPLAREWGDEVELRRLAAADSATWAESSAGSGKLENQAEPQKDLVPQVPNPIDDELDDKGPRKEKAANQKKPVRPPVEQKGPPDKKDVDAANKPPAPTNLDEPFDQKVQPEKKKSKPADQGAQSQAPPTETNPAAGD